LQKYSIMGLPRFARKDEWRFWRSLRASDPGAGLRGCSSKKLVSGDPSYIPPCQGGKQGGVVACMNGSFLGGVWRRSNLNKFDFCIGSAVKVFLTGWSKTSRCKAHENMRNEAYITVRRNDPDTVGNERNPDACRDRWVFFNSLIVLLPAG
jgi:hypothetical protein